MNTPPVSRCWSSCNTAANLLLVDAELAASTPLRQCASTRRLASQPGTFCIERLLEPYQSLLERQLSSLYNQRQA
ncbi:hypothetical protein ULG90_10715 [Halopseudomonas pachastrellae]|nr:hypothetical protein ULG90_10715 [Halopseudomonas pachastrellae]